MRPGGTLRIGLLCDTEEIALWQAQCIGQLAAVEGVEIPLVVLNGTPPVRPQRQGRLKKLLSSGLLLWRLYDRLVLSRSAQSTRRRPIAEVLSGFDQITCVPNPAGKFRQKFSKDDLAKVASYDLDVLVRFGFGILSGDILNLPKLGIWSFHHGDAQEYRGAPPGFWEIARRDPVTGVILQKLTERLDGGIILQKAWLKTLSSYPRNLDRIYFATTHLLANAAREAIANPSMLDDRSPCVTNAPVYLYPRNVQMAKFLLTSFAWRVRDQFNSLFRHQQWTIGIVDAPVETVAKDGIAGDVRWLPEPKGGYVADPFSIRSEIVAELFDWSSGRGYLVEIDPKANGQELVASEVLRPPFHLSYPFVLVNGGQAYCIPEAAEDRRVQAYSNDDWAQAHVLLEDFPALDSTIFEHEGRWWLMCTSADAGPNEFLFAWHSDDPKGPWTSHAMNPIKVDIRSARPAGGPFALGEVLVRPAQDCSTHYGARLVLNRVIRLTPEEFEEEPHSVISPDPSGKYPVGLHTINAMGSATLIDGARWIFSTSEFIRALRRKLRRQPTTVRVQS